MLIRPRSRQAPVRQNRVLGDCDSRPGEEDRRSYFRMSIPLATGGLPGEGAGEAAALRAGGPHYNTLAEGRALSHVFARRTRGCGW